MTKTGLLARLEQTRIGAEEHPCDPERSAITAKEVLDLLIEYINDPQVRGAVEKIPF